MTATDHPVFHLDMRTLIEGASTIGPLADIAKERMAQDKKFGEQNHPDGTGNIFPVARYGTYTAPEAAELARYDCNEAAKGGYLEWRHILLEEVFEAIAESDPELLRAELIQVAAVAVAWVEHIDRRHKLAEAADFLQAIAPLAYRTDTTPENGDCE